MPSLYAIDFERIPRPVVALCARLRDAGFETFLVGGGVRDLLLARELHDWDVATSAPPEAVQRLFRRTVPTGIKHGTVTVLLEDGGVEVTTYRGETRYSDARHPDSVHFVSTIEEDLARRDFTVNAMALDPIARVLVDPQGGEEDLQRRLIRAVGDPLQRFEEDGLRPMRAVRFAATLEFAVDEATLASIPRALPSFRRVSAERVRDELLKLLGAPRPSRGVELMRHAGLLAEVLPELGPGIGLKQNRFHSDDVYRHSLRVCDAVPASDAILRLAALLHDVGKPPSVSPRRSHARGSSASGPAAAAPLAEREGENTFLRHEQLGADLCGRIAQRLKLSSEERERLVHLVAEHMFPLEGWTAPGVRRFVRRVGGDRLDDLFALRAADLAGRPEAEARLAQLAALRERVREVRESRPPLDTASLAIDGDQVMARLGIEPGRRVGEILRALLERVLEEPSLNEPERLLAIVDELGAAGTGAGQGGRP